MKIKITEQQLNQLRESGMVIVDKDTDANTIKKYTDKDIKVAVVDDNESSINELRGSNSFSMDELKSIGSLAERIKYCKSTLKEIGKGSSRIVFEIDSAHVLKLALNQDGFKQNKTEYFQDYKNNPILARCVDVDKKGSLVSSIVMEKALPVDENDFKKLTGVSISDLTAVGDNATSPEEFFEEINVKYKNKNLFLKELEHLVENGNLGRGLADLLILSSYGKVLRDGKERIVLIDYGYSEESVFDYHSSSKQHNDDDIENMIRKMGFNDNSDLDFF